MRQEQLEEREIAVRPQLAGEADGWIRRADAAEHESLALRRFRQLAVVADDTDAAGGAAGTAAADAGVRHVVAQAGLEHAEALGHADRAAVAVGEVDHAAAALVDGADTLGQQRDADQAEIAEQEIIRDATECLRLRRRTELALNVLRAPFGVVVFDDHAPALIETQHRERRNQHRCGEQIRRGPLVERSHPEPEIKSDAAMDPGDGHHREHQPDPVWLPDPIHEQHLRVEFFMSVECLAEPHADDVRDNECGDAEAEYELKRLDRLPAELPALIQCPDSECGMHQARGVEQDRNRQELPEQGMEINASRQRLHRDIAECVIEEMADHISEQHHAAGKTDLPEADAAYECRQLF